MVIIKKNHSVQQDWTVMKIGKKLILVVIFIILTFTSIVLVQRYFEVKRLYTIFCERKENNIITFYQIAEMMNKKLETYVVEITYWDEMVKAVETKDINWFQASVEPTILSADNYNGVWIFDNNKKQIFSTGTQEKGFSHLFAIPEELFDKILNNKVTCHFFIEAPGGYMEINGAKIYPGSDPERKTKPRGYLFAGKLWDASYVKKITDMTSENIIVLPYSEDALRDGSNFRKGKIFFSHILPDWEGKPLAVATVTSEFSQLKAVNEAFMKDVFLFVLFTITLILFILYFILRWINLPLKLISETLTKEDVSYVKELMEEKSEFGDVSRLIKEFAEQKKKLHENEEKYRMIFNNANDAILLMDKDRFIDCNAKTLEIFGCTREQILNREPFLFSPQTQPDNSDSKEKVLEKIKGALLGAGQQFEWIHLKYDGTPFYAEVSLNTFEIAGKTHILAIVRDISERKKAEEKMKLLNRNLEEANGELKEFAYIASHDLREPLRKITSFGTILEKTLKDKIDNDESENLHFMIDGAARMRQMIDGLLSYSRVSTKTQGFENIEPRIIINELINFELGILIEETQTKINIPQELAMIKGDSLQIRQLLQNLIANGIKYQKQGSIPEITITSKPAADNMIRIEITDNGIGISPEYHNAIFNMFKRLHSHKQYEGTGIGLAVCKKIVTRHNGQIGVESQAGKGSTFWFTVSSAYSNVKAEIAC